MPIIGYPQAWSGPTNGPVTGEAIMLQLQTPADLDTWHGKLKGKIVLTVAGPLDLPFPTTAMGHRATDEELLAPIPRFPAGGAAGRGGRGGNGPTLTPEQQQAFTERMRTYYQDEGVLLTITASARGQSGVVFASKAPRLATPPRTCRR